MMLVLRDPGPSLQLPEIPTNYSAVEIAQRADLGGVVADLIEDADEDLVAED